LLRSFGLKSLNFPHGLLQVSSRTAHTAAYSRLVSAKPASKKLNFRMSTGGIVMPVFIGFLRRSDAAQRQGFGRAKSRFSRTRHDEMRLLNFAAGPGQKFRFALNRHNSATDVALAGGGSNP
jgi:hypothetical protein